MKQWVVPPGASAKFVAAMERVLSVYAEPYDAARPVVCFDERPCVLHADVREPLPMRPGSEARQDHEYVREGSCCVLMAFEPLRPTEAGTGWRQAWTLPQRRRVDFAACIRELRDEVYPDAERVRLVCDDLNTHTAASFYEAFAPAEAKRLADRVEFVYTPVHGPWLGGRTPRPRGRDRVLGAGAAVPAPSDRDADRDGDRGAGVDRAAKR